MKYTRSPVVELRICEKLLSLHQDNASIHVGTTVWPSSLVLVKFVERWLPPSSSSPNPYANLLQLGAKRAVELGAGCGAAGMGLHILGIGTIVLTDINPVMPALKHNLKRNRHVLGKTLKTAVLHWNNLEQIQHLKPPFDLVIAADVVYIEKDVGALVEAMRMLVSETGAVLLGYQVRSPEAHKLFWEICGEVFSVEKVPHEHLHDEYAYEESDVYVLRKMTIDRA